MMSVVSPSRAPWVSNINLADNIHVHLEKVGACRVASRSQFRTIGQVKSEAAKVSNAEKIGRAAGPLHCLKEATPSTRSLASIQHSPNSEGDMAAERNADVQNGASFTMALCGTFVVVAVAASPALAADGVPGGEWLGDAIFWVGQEANRVVEGQLGSLSPASVAVIFGAGLLTSISPCTLSVLPLTIGYIGGYEGDKDSSEGAQLLGNALAFTSGLATTLAALGVGASLAGRAYGQIGTGLPAAVSCIAMVMGLNLLEVVPLQLPSFLSGFDPRQVAGQLPAWAQAYLAGLTFALAASPCSTPVLASLLAYVASTRDPLLGGCLLLAYTSGYVAPLLLAASFTGTLKQILSLRKFSGWINPTSGALLLGGGLYSLLTRLFPEPSMAGML